MKSAHKGLTLIELLIAMVLGILVSGAIITVFVTNVKSSSESIRMIHLNQELRFVMGFISDELKRAGYSGSATNSDFSNSLSWDATTACLKYAYDVDGDGVLQIASESFAFQYDASEEIVRWGSGVTTDTCSNGNWQPLTSPNNAKLISFEVDANDSVLVTPTLRLDVYEISFTGTTDLVPGTATRTIRETIRVRNDHLISAPPAP